MSSGSAPEYGNADTDRTSRLVAIGLIAGDLSPLSVARYAEVAVNVATEALQHAHHLGLLSDDGTDSIDDLTRTRLIADLGRDEQARVHAAVARHLFAAGPDHLPQAIHHIRAAGALGAAEPMVALADLGGRLSLSLGGYQAASELLALAAELDSSTDLSGQGRRLCDLATATDGLGLVVDARQHLARAISLGELAGDPALVARAAVMHSLPIYWYAGNARTSAFLQRAQAMDQDLNSQVALRAARALAEIRIPVSNPDGQQYAWVTRPAVAQPLAEQAVIDSKDCDPEVQCLALMAWRTTHRAPQFLNRRREVSTQTLDLAQQLRLPPMQVEGAVWLAVDALESGDRGLYDEALSVAHWISYTDGNPRLKWRALTLALGAALLDEDHDTAHRLLSEVRGLSDNTLPLGRFALEMFFMGEQLISRDDPAELATMLLPDDTPGMASPVVRAAMGYLYARTGDADTGRRHARLALRQLDSESSFLLVATRVAAIAHAIDDPVLADDVIRVLTPWANHVSVDGNGWWCDGPVAVWLAMLHHLRGDDLAALRHLDTGEVSARNLNDVRTLRRVAALREQLVRLGVLPTAHTVDLTPRELAVLELLATGATNPSIARTLAYSLSTIRNETISLYRKLEVSGRPDAVAKALALGLVRPHG